MSKVKPTLNKADISLLKKTFITRSDDDIKAVKGVVEIAIDDAIDKKQLVTKDDIKRLPTKDDFATANAKIMKELKAVREEQKAVTNLVKRNTKRIEKLERIHPSYQHA